MIGAARPPCDDGIIRATAAPVATPARSKRLILAATILGSSMAFIDGSATNVALPSIQQRLEAGTAAAQWIVNAYLLMLGALVLVGGGMADRFGRRRIFTLGVVVFALASIACGLAPLMPVLIGARAVQGIGAALLTPASLALLGATFDERERGLGLIAIAGGGRGNGGRHADWEAEDLFGLRLRRLHGGLMELFAFMGVLRRMIAMKHVALPDF